MQGKVRSNIKLGKKIRTKKEIKNYINYNKTKDKNKENWEWFYLRFVNW